MATSQKTLPASTVTCAYSLTRWDTLVAAIASIESQTIAPHEVIVVIDHNTQLLERASRRFAEHRVVPNTHSRGLSGARNSGAQLSTGEIVAYLDDDAQAAPTWLERLLEPFAEDEVAGVSGAALPMWPTDRPRWFPAELDWAIGCSYVGLPQKTGRVRNLMGTNMSVRRTLLQSVQGFREGFGMVVDEAGGGSSRTRSSTGDDTEFCLRVSRANPLMSWIYQPSAIVYHQVSPDRTTFSYLMSRCWIEGKGKAELARLAGSSEALASERHYLRKVVPRGIWAGVRSGVTSPDPSSLSRAAALTAGVAVTGLSYAAHRVRPRREQPTR